MAESEGLTEVPQEVLKKLAALYYRQKKVEPPPGNDIPPWVRTINSMSRVDVENETRDAIRACRELKREVMQLEAEGKRFYPTVSKREKMKADLLDKWTYMSYYLYTLFRRSGVEVSEEDFDEFIRERTDSRTFFTNLSRR